MKEKALQRRNSFLLVLAAFIWGIAFVAQSEGGKFGPYTFNGIRFLLGAAVLCPVLLIMSKKNPDHKAPSPKSRKALITGGIACGIVLGFASTLQQLALFYGATAGKAGLRNPGRHLKRAQPDRPGNPRQRGTSSFPLHFAAWSAQGGPPSGAGAERPAGHLEIHLIPGHGQYTGKRPRPA